MSRKALGLIFSALAISFSALAANGKVEPIGAFSDQSAPEPVKKNLEAKGYRVTLDDGSVACEIWLRAGVATGKSETQGAVYTGLSVSTMVGVINFPKAANDFRGQAIKAGAYTLRYAVHPLDGNHLGISPIRDFLVLVPVSADQNPEAEYKFEDLMKMSMKASGTNHPAVISLANVDASAAPSVLENEHGHIIFAAKLKTQSAAEMPIAFVVKGRAEQ
ncbi:MAG TPA: hypothetical protein VJZ26_00640 [Blastocatellia bacterium]|nr:hypothetical protein [Blastocatellia bacterium]